MGNIRFNVGATKGMVDLVGQVIALTMATQTSREEDEIVVNTVTAVVTLLCYMREQGINRLEKMTAGDIVLASLNPKRRAYLRAAITRFEEAGKDVELDQLNLRQEEYDEGEEEFEQTDEEGWQVISGRGIVMRFNPETGQLEFNKVDDQEEEI